MAAAASDALVMFVTEVGLSGEVVVVEGMHDLDPSLSADVATAVAAAFRPFRLFATSCISGRFSRSIMVDRALRQRCDNSERASSVDSCRWLWWF